MHPRVQKFLEQYGRLPTEKDPDYLEMLNMGKYRILDVPDESPGKCGNCGASKNDGRKYIDFGLHVDWYGAVHLCSHCLKDIAAAMGLFESLKEELQKANETNDNVKLLQQQGARLHETVVSTFKEFEEFYAQLPSNSQPELVSAPDTNSDLDAEEPTTEPSEPRTNAPKPRATKSTSSAGRENVRSLADLLNDPGD